MNVGGTLFAFILCIGIVVCTKKVCISGFGKVITDGVLPPVSFWDHNKVF